jgi:hypothetical protein
VYFFLALKIRLDFRHSLSVPMVIWTCWEQSCRPKKAFPRVRCLLARQAFSNMWRGQHGRPKYGCEVTLQHKTSNLQLTTGGILWKSNFPPSILILLPLRDLLWPWPLEPGSMFVILKAFDYNLYFWNCLYVCCFLTVSMNVCAFVVLLVLTLI